MDKRSDVVLQVYANQWIVGISDAAEVYLVAATPNIVYTEDLGVNRA